MKTLITVLLLVLHSSTFAKSDEEGLYELIPPDQIIPDQNVFFDRQTGDATSFDKIMSAGRIRVLKDMFWCVTGDSSRPHGVVMSSPQGRGYADCHSVFWTTFIVQKRRYLASETDVNSALLEKGEIFGFKKKIWDLNVWRNANASPKDVIAFASYDLVSKGNLELKDLQNTYKFIYVDPAFLTHYEKIHLKTPPKVKKAQEAIPVGNPLRSAESDSYLIKLLAQSSRPVSRAVRKRGDPWETAKGPILCVEPDSHFQRIDKNDWQFNGFLNWGNGDFYLYASFEKLDDYLDDLNSRTLALDYMGGVNKCRLSTVGVVLDSKKKIFNSVNDIRLSPQLLISVDQKGKAWKPLAPPEDKNTILEDRLQFILNPYMFFGSWCPIWELDIWPKLGYFLKQHPEGIYLCGYGTLLQAAETKTVAEEHALIKKCGIQITPTTYQMFERMRQKQQQGN